jgi:hypothetical protein
MALATSHGSEQDEAGQFLLELGFSLSWPPLDFQPSVLLCWPRRPNSAKSGQASMELGWLC